MSSEQVAPPEVAETPTPRSRRGLSSRWFLLIGGVIVFNIIALILVPPFPKGGNPGDECAYPGLLHQRHARVPGAARRLGADRVPSIRRPT